MHIGSQSQHSSMLWRQITKQQCHSRKLCLLIKQGLHARRVFDQPLIDQVDQLVDPGNYRIDLLKAFIAQAYLDTKGAATTVVKANPRAQPLGQAISLER